MSEQTHRDVDTSTPTVEEAALYWQWGGHMWQAPERFDRMIAKVKADALRAAADDVTAIDGRRDDAVANWLRDFAGRIDKEA